MTIIGKPCTPEQFEEYVRNLKWTGWKPTGICLHHCAAPSLAQRPNGFTEQHMKNLQSYYEGKGWSAGPHLFIDEDQIWLFSPMTSKGVHAVSFNSTHIGIEMLGDYDSEEPWEGRGLSVLNCGMFAIKTLAAKLNFNMDAISANTSKVINGYYDINGWLKFHRNDTRTNKTCPGHKIDTEDYISKLKA